MALVTEAKYRVLLFRRRTGGVAAQGGQARGSVGRRRAPHDPHRGRPARVRDPRQRPRRGAVHRMRRRRTLRPRRLGFLAQVEVPLLSSSTQWSRGGFGDSVRRIGGRVGVDAAALMGAEDLFAVMHQRGDPLTAEEAHEALQAYRARADPDGREGLVKLDGVHPASGAYRDAPRSSISAGRRYCRTASGCNGSELE